MGRDNSVKFSSVQGGIYALGMTNMRSTPSLRSFPNVALKNSSNVGLIDDGPSRKIVERFLLLRLSPPGDRWCDVFDFVPVVSVSSSWTLQIFRDATRLWWVFFRVYLLSFPLTPACPGQYNIDTCQPGLPISFYTFCSRLIESVRMMACEVWLSPLEAIQRRACVTASISIVKLVVETLRMHCLREWWSHLA